MFFSAGASKVRAMRNMEKNVTVGMCFITSWIVEWFLLVMYVITSCVSVFIVCCRDGTVDRDRTQELIGKIPPNISSYYP